MEPSVNQKQYRLRRKTIFVHHINPPGGLKTNLAFNKQFAWKIGKGFTTGLRYAERFTAFETVVIHPHTENHVKSHIR